MSPQLGSRRGEDATGSQLAAGKECPGGMRTEHYSQGQVD